MPDAQDRALRAQMVELLGGGRAYAKFEGVIAGMSAKLYGRKPKGLAHSAWMLLEHMRIAQWDILEFSRNSQARFAGLAGGVLAGVGDAGKNVVME